MNSAIKKNTVLKIRRAGYPESQVTLNICVQGNNRIYIIAACVIVICMLSVYTYRKRMVKPDAADIVEDDTEEPDNDEQADTEAEHLQETNEDKYKNYKLSDEECKRLIKILDKEMMKNKLYTNKSLKIADLANVANTSSHALSYVFNQYLQKTYYDYINEYRVEEFKSAIQKEKYSKYTLEALSEHCGFSSRASFFRSFKKVTGITPNEYIKNIKSGGRNGKE